MKLSELWKNPLSLKLRRARREYFLALDFGSVAQKALLFQRTNGKIIVLRSSLQYSEPSRIFDSLDFEAGLVKKELVKMIKEVTSPGKFQMRPKYVILSLPANILKSQIFFQKLKRKEPKEKIQKSEAESIAKEILKKSKKEISEAIQKKTGILQKDINFLDLKILKIEIDGYEVPQLLNYSGQNLDFRVISTFLLRSDFQKVEKIIKNLHFRIFKIEDPAHNFISALEDEKLSGIFLDVGGKISQITIIKDGKIQGITVFEKGGDDFSKALSQTLGVGKDEAEDLKLRYAKKMLSEEVRRRMKEIFSPPIQEWFQGLKLKLREVQRNKELLPQNIFLFGGGSLLPEIQDILNEGDWEKLSFLKTPKVQLLFPKNLKNFEDKTQTLNSPQNISSILICYEST